MAQLELYPETLGQALESLHATSIARWRNTYNCRVAINDLLGHEIEQISLSCIHKRGGRVQVYITMQARLKHRSETHFYQLQRTGPNEYVVVGHSESDA